MNNENMDGEQLGEMEIFDTQQARAKLRMNKAPDDQGNTN